MAPTTDLTLLRAKLILACRDTVPVHIYYGAKVRWPNALTEPWFKHDVKLKPKRSKHAGGAGSLTDPVDLITSSDNDKDDGDEEGNSWLWVCGDAHKKELKKVAARRRRDRTKPTRSGRFEVADSETEVEDELVTRYVVLDSQTWELEEVESAEAARGRANNPPVEAGRGVVVFVNDAMHYFLDHGLRYGLYKKQEREFPFTERGVPVNARMMDEQEEQAWRERKLLGIPDDVPVGSSLFYHVWAAVRGLREGELEEVGSGFEQVEKGQGGSKIGG